MSGVLVVVEQQNATAVALSRISLEALAAGQQLAKQLGVDCSAAVLGDGSRAARRRTQREATRQGLRGRAPAAEAIHRRRIHPRARAGHPARPHPATSSFPHTYQVRDFAPALATRFGQVLISDVIAIHDGPDRFVRQLFQGKLNADYRPPAQPAPCFVSIQAGASARTPLEAGTAPQSRPSPSSLTPRRSAPRPGWPFRESAHTVDLAAAPVIVSVGRGIREQENIPLVQALADALGAELAASRPICDAGWLPMERQVGSSGQTVSPKLYLAVGISGAIQHLVGMKGSKTVIAINKDENAPIFEVADYGVAGDLFEIVPALTKAILAAKG